MGAVQFGAVEEFGELVAFGRANDLLQRDQVGIEATQFVAKQVETPAVAFEVPDVDRQYAQSHEHPSMCSPE
jgi:hypothetical protein